MRSPFRSKLVNVHDHAYDKVKIFSETKIQLATKFDMS